MRFLLIGGNDAGSEQPGSELHAATLESLGSGTDGAQQDVLRRSAISGRRLRQGHRGIALLKSIGPIPAIALGVVGCIR